MQIKLSCFGSLPVIIFKNHSTGLIDSWVCESEKAKRQKLKELKKLKHIEVLAAKHACVKFEDK